ncbi:MAG: arsenate reductase ArsC, partial [Geminicoccaceae bacterium]
MSKETFNVLFLCTANSARSIMAECALRHRGEGRLNAFSAGSHPSGKVHPVALELMRKMGFETGDLRSKSWDEFSGPGAPVMDFVFTVCGNAAGETCPVWPGHPATAHWGVEDPAAFDGPPEVMEGHFRRAYAILDKRVRAFAGLPFGTLDRQFLQQRLAGIGEL